MTKFLHAYRIQLISRSLLFLAGLLGVSLQLIKNGGASMLLYYTILSNILVTVFAGYLVYLMIRQDRRYQSNSFLRNKTGVTMAILITFVIYHTMLRPYIFPAQFWRIENFLCHYIVPLWFFVDGLLFDGKIAFGKLDPFRWTLAPLLYTLLALFNGLVTKFAIPGAPNSPFAYPFLDVYSIGWSGVLTSSLFIMGFYIIGGYVLMGVKWLVGRLLKY